MQCQCLPSSSFFHTSNFTLKINPALSIENANTYIDKVEGDYGKQRASPLTNKIVKNSSECPYIVFLSGVASSRQQISGDIAQLIMKCSHVSLQEMLQIISSNTNRTKEKSVSLLLTMITNGWLLVFNAERPLSTFDFLFILFEKCELIGAGYDEFHQKFIERAIDKGNDFRLIMKKLYFGKDSRGLRSIKTANAVRCFSNEIKKELNSLGVAETYRSRKDWIVWRKIGAKKRWDINEKVYISAQSSKIDKNFLDVIFDVFVNSPATSMKMILNERVANRCDAIVMYCDSENFDGNAITVANLISEKIEELTIRGRRVPFSRPHYKSELISFGVDFRWLKLSWRQFVCTVIAKALMLNHNEKNKIAIHQGLNIYLALAGIRSDKWEASQSTRSGLIKHAVAHLFRD
ncbi:hypothetical protein LQR31_02640 [Chromobacterium vaccinii]|uniref:hypothetical protein n=1 Tax=Chromobacterium vaccinii TaxID=1108595 RepID=UPI001E2B520F|nr:hypothetical protein [Chromobacterium vaccinii]MCD4483368.1 hypothetical protein [Chromobacterium vaccinii]